MACNPDVDTAGVNVERKPKHPHRFTVVMDSRKRKIRGLWHYSRAQSAEIAQAHHNAGIINERTDYVCRKTRPDHKSDSTGVSLMP